MSEALAMPDLAEATGWIGTEVTEMGGTKIGEVQGIFVDEGSGRPAWLVVRLGRRRKTRVVAVPLGLCAGAPFGVWVADHGEKLASAPVVDPARPLRREHELTICAHFGIGEGIGRAAEVGDRAEGSITAAPPGG
jgi:PRC-barrel domain